MQSIETAINEMISKNGADCVSFALRSLHKSEPREPGSFLSPSYDWIDGNQTDTQLDGTCGIWFDVSRYNDGPEVDSDSLASAVKIVSNYCFYSSGATIAVIGGDSYEHGEDDGEIILENARVIGIVEI